MRFTIFTGRNFKEIVRDPMSILMCLGFPVLLILALALMKESIGEWLMYLKFKISHRV